MSLLLFLQRNDIGVYDYKKSLYRRYRLFLWIAFLEKDIGFNILTEDSINMNSLNYQ